MPFIRRRTLTALHARVAMYAQATRNALRVEHTALENYKRLAAEFTGAGDAATELVESRRLLAAKDRRIELLQGQLDELLGLNNPAVAAGSNWQARREDKIPGVKP